MLEPAPPRAPTHPTPRRFTPLRSSLLRAITVIGIVVAGPSIVSCVPSRGQTTSDAALKVLATTTQVHDLVRNIGGDRITVTPILQGDDDAHDYQPTAVDARNIAEADVIFANGIGLEPWLDDLAQGARPGVPVVNLAEQSGIAPRPGDEESPLGDPHVWFDPTNVRRIVMTIRDTLATADPEGRSTYEANTASYDAQLDQLDREIMAQWAQIPPGQRTLVTNHDAFGSYVDRYGITFVGSVIPSLSTEAEPSAAEVQQLVEEIRAQNVRTIFTEASVNARLAEQISQQTGVRIFQDLYGDALGEPGSEGDTYLRMIRFNTNTMIAGMTG
ncbi:MAG: zinc ABC transporter substrate-binding protein [Chloroflexi bacterium]|nr:zinc ABC transporter substrate-binding protein [Chloroflexota bacterium]